MTRLRTTRRRSQTALHIQFRQRQPRAPKVSLALPHTPTEPAIPHRPGAGLFAPQLPYLVSSGQNPRQVPTGERVGPQSHGARQSLLGPVVKPELRE